MKFYSDIEGNETIVIDGKALQFVDGVIETEDTELIEKLKPYYRGEEDGKAKQGDTKGQEIEGKQDIAETEEKEIKPSRKRAVK